MLSKAARPFGSIVLAIIKNGKLKVVKLDYNTKIK